MKELTAKMGENGRVVIPAICRQKLKLQPGEELIFRIEDDELHISSLKHSLEKAQKLVKHYAKNRSLVKKLQQIRQEDE